jgi:tetratricopeptide (TPR) repeat protein
MVLGPGTRVSKYRMRAIWDDGLPVRWREGEGLPAMRPRKANGATEIGLALDDIEPTIMPKQAPARYALTRNVEMTTLKSWNALSQLFSPLYAKASTLKPDSPLRADIATIAAASPDPVKRAEAALALVQGKVRYVFLGMNDGGLVPADADLTWQRRFADCKGKTALLLALLHELGISAEPAIVSTALGDGLDQRMPMVALFNHVIVRATIGGKVYWLDGTRTGDTRLADIKVPDFRFALPLTMAGAGVEPLDVPVPAKPLQEYVLKVDMTAGVSRPFPFHVEEISRGDAALITHLRIDDMTPDVRQQTLRDYFAGQYADVEPKTYSAAWDAVTGEEKLVMDGLEKHDWRWAYELDHAAIGWKADLARAPGPHADAPFEVDYPAFTVAHETILLPNEGRGMLNRIADVDRTVAGVEYHRKARIANGVLSVDTSTRAISREFPAAEAPAAQASLRELAGLQPLVSYDNNYQSTPQEREAAINDPHLASDYNERAWARLGKRDLPGALADAEQAIKLQSNIPGAYTIRGIIYVMQGRTQEGLADLQKAVVLAPEWVNGRVRFAGVLASLGRNDEALAEVNRAVALDPRDYGALNLRAEIQRQLGHFDEALADAAGLIQSPVQEVRFQGYRTRANLFLAKGQSDKAIGEGKAMVAAYPQWDEAHILLGATYIRLGDRQQGMMEFDRAIAIKPSVEAYLTRANNRPKDDLAGKRADLAAALKLEPKNAEAKALSLVIEYGAGGYSKVVADASATLIEVPANRQALLYRGLAYAKTEHMADADRDFAAARKLVADNAGALNNLCWSKAILGVALESALEDCDAALKLQPDAGQIIDSRAFVLFRLGRYSDAVSAYDRAIALNPKQAASLYMRGIARRRLGKVAEGDADIAAAKAIQAKVDQEFIEAGVTL